ncbi:MAG: helix-turn-helix transcriptional regulator [Thermaerobacter sp.]|nr:helix-turn-helix transcriptional regulator [Thermaerobacter sp.]
MPEDFGRRLERLMRERDLNQKMLAKRAGIHEVSVHRYIRKGQLPRDLDVVRRLALGLDVPMRDLMETWEDRPMEEDRPPSAGPEQIDLSSSLSAEERFLRLAEELAQALCDAQAAARIQAEANLRQADANGKNADTTQLMTQWTIRNRESSPHPAGASDVERTPQAAAE